VIRRIILLAIVVLFLAVIVQIYLDTNFFKVVEVQLTTRKIPAGEEIRILQISDLHDKVFGKDNESLVEAIHQVDADVIVITGDLIDRSTKDLGRVFSLVERITAKHQRVYFISGNHENANRLRRELLDGLVSRGVIVLNNGNVELEVRGTAFNLAGVEDGPRKNVNQAMEGINPDLYTVLLSHRPDLVARIAEIPVDLILSGHTHGGQVRLPFVGAIYAPNQGWLPKYDKGMFQILADRHLYVDSGLGTTHLPIRFLNKAQMSVIRIIGCG
jgi:hypothetical protein